MSQIEYPVTFMDKVSSLRQPYDVRRVASNLYPPTGQPMKKLIIEHTISYDVFSIWYEDDGSGHRHVRLHNIPGTLSGDILRLHRDLPPVPFHIEIHGDSISTIGKPPAVPVEPAIDDEDCSSSLELLPVVETDLERHFTRRARYNSEILNYLKLQNQPASPMADHQPKHIITLLGRNTENEMVFPKVLDSQSWFVGLHDIFTYKEWILELISALRFLHSHCIIHKNLRIANILLVPPPKSRRRQTRSSHLRLVLCGLGSRWGNRDAPELDKTAGSDAGWSEKSDIYDISLCIKSMLYGNHPANSIVGAEWEVPAPLDEICKACIEVDPEKRPTLDKLEALVRAIPTT